MGTTKRGKPKTKSYENVLRRSVKRLRNVSNVPIAHITGTDQLPVNTMPTVEGEPESLVDVTRNLTSCSVWFLVVAIISLIGSGGMLYLYCSYNDGKRVKKDGKKDGAETEPAEEEHDLESPPQREDLQLEVAEKPSKVPTRVWPPPRKQHPKPHQAQESWTVCGRP